MGSLVGHSPAWSGTVHREPDDHYQREQSDRRPSPGSLLGVWKPAENLGGDDRTERDAPAPTVTADLPSASVAWETARQSAVIPAMTGGSGNALAAMRATASPTSPAARGDTRTR